MRYRIDLNIICKILLHYFENTMVTPLAIRINIKYNEILKGLWTQKQFRVRYMSEEEEIEEKLL